MSHTCRLLVLFIIAISSALSITEVRPAQAATTPLFVELGDSSVGDIFAYTPAGFQQLTHYGYNEPPVLSPDGKYLVYGSYAATFMADEANGNGRSGPPAVNLWLMETATGHAKRIADQPPDTRAPGDQLAIRPFTARTSAAWSPDGKALAWFEKSEGMNTNEADGDDHLKIYTLADGSTSEIYKQPEFAAGCPCSDVTWTTFGLGVVHTPGEVGPPFNWRWLSPKGQAKADFSFDSYPSVMWLNGESTPTIITDTELITLNDKTHSKTLPPLEIYSLSAPKGVHFRSDSGYFDGIWSLIAPGIAPLELGGLDSYAISPDGKQAAYISGTTLVVYDGQQTTYADLSGIKVRDISPLQAHGLGWSALAIRIATAQ